jgi:hypothetical protein
MPGDLAAMTPAARYSPSRTLAAPWSDHAPAAVVESSTARQAHIDAFQDNLTNLLVKVARCEYV